MVRDKEWGLTTLQDPAGTQKPLVTPSCAVRTNHEESLEIAATDTMLPNAVIAASLLFYGDKSISDPFQNFLIPCINEKLTSDSFLFVSLSYFGTPIISRNQTKRKVPGDS